MKRILFFLITILIFNTGCKKFLEKTPSEGGIAGFESADQFDALLNEIRITRNRYEWNTIMYGSDDCHYHPDWQTTSATYQQREAFNVWNNNELRGITGTSNGFNMAWSYMYTFNYITDRIDAPEISGSELLKSQVKGEAMFWRAFYYFNLAVQYAMHPGLNNGNYPGLAYRNTVSTDPETYSDRRTIRYTMDGIVNDLDQAERLLREGGKADMNTSTPWRITVPAVHALRARVELYQGNYKTAFDHAKQAYNAYEFLYDMNDASLFTMVNRTNTSATCNGTPVASATQSPTISGFGGNSTHAHGLWNYKESFFRFVCQISAIDKLPPTQELYDMYAAEDLRKVKFYDNNMNAANSPFSPCRKDELISKNYMKHAINASRSGYVLGVSVPEVMLIMAECRARGAGDGQPANETLKALRKTRFPTGYTDNIGSTLKDVLDERRRELAFVMRWYDVKRYNALDNANITISKLARRDVYQLNSDFVTHRLAPNALAYAQPIPETEIVLLKTWAQNETGGITVQ